MQTINLNPIFHNKEECIGIFFTYSKALNNIVQKIVNAKWSSTQKCWYVPCTKEAYTNLSKELKGKAILETKALQDYLQQRKKVTDKLLVDSAPKVQLPLKPVASKKISKSNEAQLNVFLQQLQLKAYSKSTIKTYTNEFSAFLQIIGRTKAETFTTQRIKDYLQYCHNTLHLSENTIHSRMNALKFYYEQVLKREKLFWEIPRPKKPIQIPKMFSKEDIEKILKATENLKHKTALLLCYSSGLRVSEVVSLKITSIDSQRMVINILAAKGKKDRIVPLSKTTLKYLQDYYKLYKPQLHLFEGQFGDDAWGARSLQKVMDNAKIRAKINKPGSIHALRHSYATHLLDKGVDITYIQKLLGHNDLKTTLRYLHVTIRDLSRIESPIEDLDI